VNKKSVLKVEIIFSATLGASLIVHFYFALLIKKNWVETQSMITGRVPLREYLHTHSLLE